MYDAIDVPMNIADNADDIAARGVRTVIRYYNHRNSNKLPTKRLEAEEAAALTEANLAIAVVFQQRGGAGGHIDDLDAQSGRADAKRALQLARGLKQPKGSAIYFAVDHDYFRRSELDRIVPYFEEVRSALGSDYKVGVYGSGTVATVMIRKELADLAWLAGATGWSGTRDMLKTDRWALFQKYLHKTWPGGAFTYDGNIVSPAFADFGQFRLDGEAPETTASTVVLMEVTARSGLKIRKGPGTEYADSGSLPEGAIVSAIGRSGDWVKVDLEGDGIADGFMHGAFLRPSAGGFPIEGAYDRPIDVAYAEMRLGVKEYAGSAHNPRIVMYHATTDGGAHPDETAWCSSFVNYCVEQAGLNGTDNKWAMSWHDSGWGTDVTGDPRDGDIAVFRRRSGSSGGKVLGGHVGFWTGASDGKIRLLGGNQSDSVRISEYPENGMLGSMHFECLSIRRPY